MNSSSNIIFSQVQGAISTATEQEHHAYRLATNNWYTLAQRFTENMFACTTVKYMQEVNNSLHNNVSVKQHCVQQPEHNISRDSQNFFPLYICIQLPENTAILYVGSSLQQ